MEYKENFNTSHVTVYPFKETENAPGHRISIHPMLRFILLKKRKMLLDIEFQYIPCYGLSRT